MNNPKREKSIKKKIGYASGDILGGGAFTLIGLLFMFYLTTYMAISPAYAGLIFLIGKIFDAITDPIMGNISDRTVSRFGRRRIYFLIGIPLIFISFILMWYSAGTLSEIQKVIYFTFAYCFFSASFTVVMVPYNALLPDMETDYTKKVSFSTWRMLFSELSALLSATIPSLILGSVSSRTSNDYFIMAIVFASIYSIPLFLTFFWTKEKENIEKTNYSLKESIKEFFLTLKNKTYRIYIGIFLFSQMATDIFSTCTAYWLYSYLNLDKTDTFNLPPVTLIAGITLIMALLTLPINNKLSYKFGKHSPSYIILPLRVISLAVAFFITKDTPLAMIIAVAVINGIGTSTASFVPWTILPDIPDSDYMITGKRNAGIYSGGATFLRKLTNGLSVFITGIVLSLFGFAQSSSGNIIQSDTAKLGIRIMFCIVPLFLTILAIVFSRKYKLNKERHALILKAIKCREEGKICQDKKVIKACEEVSGLSFESMWIGRN